MYPLFAKAPCTPLHHHVRFAPASSDSNPRLARKTFLQTVLAVAISILAPIVAHAGSATWDLNATSGDWNTAANWTPMTVPNGPADIATFGLSNTTNVSISANTEVNSITFTAAATNPYLIAVNSVTLTLSGTGITNNSGRALVIASEDNGESSQIHFTNGATAGNATIPLNGGRASSVDFFDYSTAGSALIGSAALFEIINFHDYSTAGSATISTGDTGSLRFSNHSSAGSATIGGIFHSLIEFSDFSTAGSATIQVHYVLIQFSGSSQGGTSTIGLFALENGSNLGISGHVAPGVTIGSLEGDERSSVSLGANNLTIGSNNLSTTFSGFIEDNGSVGSLTKIGNGMLVLNGENTYSGGTAIKGGKLVINNTTGSGTGSGPVQVNAGQLGGSGVISGDVTIGDASHRRGTLSPGDSGHRCDTLTIQGTLTFQSDAIYKFNLKSSTAESDSVVANGVTINSAALFDFTGVGHRRLPIGTIFRVIDNISVNPIAGTFSNLPDQSTFIIKGNKYQVSYQGGDGNDLTLTVMP